MRRHQPGYTYFVLKVALVQILVWVPCLTYIKSVKQLTQKKRKITIGSTTYSTTEIFRPCKHMYPEKLSLCLKSQP